MVECDGCGTEVPEVWRHREFTETMTHRSITWVCRGCHPSIPETVTASASTTEVAMTDGGAPALACPTCGGPTVDGQGLLDCLDCDWSGRT